VSATRLLVLGVVRMHGRAHGYQVRRDLLTWSADRWANVAPGSIYHALKKMAQEKLIEEVRTEVDGGEARGPDRTAYQLTPDGETEFQIQVAKGISEADDSVQGVFRFNAAIIFLPTMSRAKAISLLGHRITHLRGQRANVKDVLDHGTDWGQPEHINELYRLWLANFDATLRWQEGLVSRLEAGEYVMADDPGTAFGEPGSGS
jgi:DNA-binding PadR family transcriptional regulator